MLGTIEEIREFIQREIIEQETTQGKIAERVGCLRTTVNSVLSSKNMRPSRPLLIKIMKELGYDLEVHKGPDAYSIKSRRLLNLGSK